jgi:hypothetical protein
MSRNKILADLIEKLRVPCFASRELDAEIALLNGWKRTTTGVWAAPGASYDCGVQPPRYTASMDAAMYLPRSPNEFVRVLDGMVTMLHDATDPHLDAARTFCILALQARINVFEETAP